MRDTDRDLRSLVVVQANSQFRTLTDLDGRVVATGAVDSPQSTLIPLQLFQDNGVRPALHRFDVGVGLHGDHIGGERAAARALMAGEVDAACIIDSNHLAFGRDGILTAGATRIVGETPVFDHCNMTVTEGSPTGLVDAFGSLLLAMDYADARVRPLLDLEGLSRWLPGRTTGYDQLERSVDTVGFYDEIGTVTARDYLP